MTQPGSGIYEQRFLDGRHVSEICAGVAIGREAGTRKAVPQDLDAAAFLAAAPIGGRERTIKAAVPPGDAGAECLLETKAASDLRHIEIDARRQQNESIASLAMTGDRGQGTRAKFRIVESRDKLHGPVLHRIHGRARHAGAKQIGLQAAAIRTGQCVAKTGGDDGPDIAWSRVASKPAAQIGDKRILACDRAVEIEYRDPHRRVAQAAS